MGRKNFLLSFVFAGGIFLFPMVTPNPYYLSVLVIVGIHGLIVLGLTLFMGFAGQVSLGHSAFYGIGAYTSAILTVHFGWPVILALLSAVAVTAFIALLISFPILRLKGFYLGMVTLGFAEITYIVIKQMENLTGGGSGLGGIPNISFFGTALDTDVKYYYLVWVLFFGFTVFSLNFLPSRSGRALRAIHHDEIAANVMGVNTPLYKTIVFVMSAISAGLAGALYAHYVTFLAPDVFDIMFNVMIIAMVVIGGSGSIWGAFLGTLLLTSLPQLMVSLQNFQTLVFGLIIILMIMFFPKGLTGVLDRIAKASFRVLSLRGRV